MNKYNHTYVENVKTNTIINKYFFLKDAKNDDGYKRVYLSVVSPKGARSKDSNKYRKVMSTHRLVAQAFVPNPDNLPQVNHKDLCRDNNHVCNLEPCDSEYNMIYSAEFHKLEKEYGTWFAEICPDEIRAATLARQAEKRKIEEKYNGTSIADTPADPKP